MKFNLTQSKVRTRGSGVYVGGERLEVTPGLVGIAFPISFFLLFDTSGREYKTIGRTKYVMIMQKYLLRAAFVVHLLESETRWHE